MTLTSVNSLACTMLCMSILHTCW